MNALTLQTEGLLRLGVFIGLFVLLAGLELLFPRRQLSYSKLQRWRANLLVSALNTLLARLLIPIAGVGAALYAAELNLGLFNQLPVPLWIEVPVFLLLFDLTIYLQHRLFHAIPVLWRLHRMHHTDPDYDVTTGNRFHPVSIILSGLIKTALVFLLGPGALAVILAEILLNATSMFNHSNIRLPASVDRRLRLLLVTPDMHRVHHSTDDVEHNHNFGFNFPWWDRLFGTYRAQPDAGHEQMDIGIKGFQNDGAIKVIQMLMQPLRKNGALKIAPDR